MTVYDRDGLIVVRRKEAEERTICYDCREETDVIIMGGPINTTENVQDIVCERCGESLPYWRTETDREPKEAQINLRINSDLKAKFQDAANRAGCTLTDFIIEAVEGSIEKRDAIDDAIDAAKDRLSSAVAPENIKTDRDAEMALKAADILLRHYAAHRSRHQRKSRPGRIFRP